MKINPLHSLIRPLSSGEAGLLRRFLYEAIFVPEGMPAPPESIVDAPELKVYTEDFGSRKDDLCLVAEQHGVVVGAVWTRIMDDFGHVDGQTPSLAISLLPEYRGKGTGSRLLSAMLELLRQKGYSRVSLSVQKENRAALQLYLKHGFHTVRESDEEYVMVAELGGNHLHRAFFEKREATD